MSQLADLETALRCDRAYARLSQSHTHLASREDSLGILKGRDALTNAWIGEESTDLAITADMGNMIAYKVDDWHGHRWVWRQDDRILREVVVEDRGVSKTAPPIHSPLGELRAGEGQFGATQHAILPPYFPEGARALADRLHQAWNNRAFDLYYQPWLSTLIRLLPDARFYFERAIMDSCQTALLWRVHGHHANGQRIRLIGSSIFTGDTDETILDHAALEAQAVGQMIDYASA
jgi:hypothetical protein